MSPTYDPFQRPDDGRLDEVELAETARQVKDALEPPAVDPAFRARLHAQLVAEGARRVPQQPRRPWWERWFRPPGPRTLVPVLATLLVVALLATLAISRLLGPGSVPVTMSSSLQGQATASASAPVVLHFSKPMDHSSVVAALRISPATDVRTSWQGDNLVITPVHGLASGVPYQVSVDASQARTSGGAAPTGSLSLYFGTGPQVVAGEGTGALGQAAAAFAGAQVQRDTGALAQLSGPGLQPASLPDLSRAWVTSVEPTSQTTATAQVSLLVDAGPGHPRSRVATEELHLQLVGRNQRALVESLTVSPFANLAAGPHIVHVGLDAATHTVLVTYDCDMDPSSVEGSNRATGSGGRTVPVTTGYDPATKTVSVHVPASVQGPIQLSVSRGLRDIHDRHLATPFHTTVTLGAR
ncbi:MAG: Ig-like domain-containing protein [Candidatus Dormibacteraeota bacterium]|nr:Ig-like domain-containing protein [Candidatus Dormibacteraeota bacterium]